MRICLVSPYDLALEGGVNKHIFYLAKSLRASGDEVEVIGPASAPVQGDVDVTTFGGIASIQANESDNRIGLWTSPLHVRRYMKSRHFDVIHVHEPLIPSLSWYARWTTDAPAQIATYHCYTEHESLRTRMIRQLFSPALRRFQRGIAVSKAAATYASVAWKRPLSIIANGVDTSFFTPLKHHDPRRDAGPVQLLFVGQWTDKRKGLPVLLDAFSRLRARKVDVTLDVVGQGDPRVPIPAAPAGVMFHGRVSEIELRRRMRECDIFVAPSTGQESFGIVLVEAMAAGRPVVCSDIDGYRDVATGYGARRVPPRDGSALAGVLQELCRDAGLRRAMGQKNRADAMQYDWSVLSQRIREEYELALAATTSRRPSQAPPEAWQPLPVPVHEDADAVPQRVASQ